VEEHSDPIRAYLRQRQSNSNTVNWVGVAVDPLKPHLSNMGCRAIFGSYKSDGI